MISSHAKKETVSTKYIDELMRKIRAMVASEAATPGEIAGFVFSTDKPTASHSVSVSRWLNGSDKPGGNYALALSEFAAAKTLEIEKAGKDAKAKYRAAYEATK